MTSIKFTLVLVSSWLCLPHQSALAQLATTGESSAVKAFVSQLYTTPINDIEGKREFKGKYNPDFGCNVLRTFLKSDLIKQDRLRGCMLVETIGEGFFRYPNLDGEEIADLEADKTLPRFTIESISVEGSTAIVKVTIPAQLEHADGSRVVYGLEKLGNTWKIANLLAYKHWPVKLNQDDPECRGASSSYSFLRPPVTDALIQDLPVKCRTVEMSFLRKRSDNR